MSTELYNILDKVTPEDSDHHVEQKKLLWTNGSTSSSFAGQTILNSGELGDYSEVLILYKGWNDWSEYDYNVFVAIGASFRMTGGNTVFAYRDGSITSASSGIVFGNGYYTNAYNSSTTIQTNNVIIPTKIYGIKNLES